LGRDEREFGRVRFLVNDLRVYVRKVKEGGRPQMERLTKESASALAYGTRK